jgi:hypothetical protein
VHRPDRVDHVLAGDLDVRQPVVGKGDRAPGDAELGQRRLVVPGEVRAWIAAGPVDQQDRRPCGAVDVAGALEGGLEIGLGDAQRGTRSIDRGVLDRGGGGGQRQQRPQHDHADNRPPHGERKYQLSGGPDSP